MQDNKCTVPISKKYALTEETSEYSNKSIEI